MRQQLQNKKNLVKDVFEKVFDKYDLMNDVMSLGAHRIWKRNLINMMSPLSNKKLIDVACGTGDIAQLYLKKSNINNYILSIDPNKGMLKIGKEKLSKYKNIEWKLGSAENLPAPSNFFDFYTISFGLRNTKNLKKTLDEAYRVLKPGGKFLCLEFSKVENDKLDFVYENYSKLIPTLGKIIIGDGKPYEYLVKSIKNFVTQDELLNLIKESNFHNSNYVNISAGIVAIHYGWKI
ncbi:MAG: bifunctional demethylmenaquinone methyltransferase/2-methoxy-6-polyprenyl-1,4-benzoquinol methylase [Candidatus Pelagibacter sp. TMED275]|mgnify:CR=1 FL=1|nr:MAG: bifunctional demethylmenaquinone methyltransferase/2-methoxy-6-polyprenyl-1,4-benzoquinol methylase [Candidatus Pelagibacter sp. TMED275]